MALKDECSSINVNGKRAVTRLAATGKTILLSEVVCILLKPTKIFLRFRRLLGLYISRSKEGRQRRLVALP